MKLRPDGMTVQWSGGAGLGGGWQPIETMPKGELALVCGSNWTAIGSYKWRVTDTKSVEWFWDYVFITSFGAGTKEDPLIDLTDFTNGPAHWMPLPEPPCAPETEAAKNRQEKMG